MQDILFLLLLLLNLPGLLIFFQHSHLIHYDLVEDQSILFMLSVYVAEVFQFPFVELYVAAQIHLKCDYGSIGEILNEKFEIVHQSIL